MSPAEAAALLGVAASFDNRKPDEIAAQAWSLALDGRRFEDCRDAIVRHYSRTTEWLMPAHVLEGVKAIRHERLRDFGPIEPPAELDPDNDRAYIEWMRDAQLAIADGRQPPQAEPYNELHARPAVDYAEIMPRVPRRRGPWEDRHYDPEYQEKRDAARAELAAREPVEIPAAEDES